MSTKKRILRILLIAFLVLVFAGYFAFSTFLFSPTENDFEADVSTLVPENVDFFVAKAKLDEDFVDFPKLAIADALQSTRAWSTFESSGGWGALQRSLGLQQLEARIDELKKQSHGVELLHVFGGKDVAVAGSIKVDDLAASTWCVYGRVNWIGKLGFSLCKYPGVLGLDKQGIAVKDATDHFEFTGAGIPQPIFAARIRDVVLVANSLDLVTKAIALDQGGGQGSFGQGAQYFDHITKAPRNAKKNEIELYLSYRDLAKALHLPDHWPDAQSDDLTTAFCGRMFQLGSINKLAGIVGFDGGIQATLHADLSSELMTPVQQKIYRRHGVQRAVFARDVSKLARNDAALFLVVQAQFGDVLRELLASSEKALRQNLEDLLRETGEFKLTDAAQTNTEALIQELDGLFRDRIAIIVRINDYPQDPEKDAPHNDDPTAAWTIALWTDGSEKARARIKKLEEMVNRHARNFGIAGRKPDEHGVYTNNCAAGNFEIWEFWSQFVPGTGHIATAINGDLVLISNHFRMVCEVLNTADSGHNEQMYPRLADRPDFKALANDSLPEANLMAWIDPKNLNAILAKYMDRRVQDELESRTNWKTERNRIETEVLQQSYPGQTKDKLNTDDAAQFKQIVDGKIKELEQKLQTEQGPAIRRELERNQTYLGTASAAVITLALDPKYLDIALRSFIPLDVAK